MPQSLAASNGISVLANILEERIVGLRIGLQHAGRGTAMRQGYRHADINETAVVAIDAAAHHTKMIALGANVEGRDLMDDRWSG